jgi:hypothetical protein
MSALGHAMTHSVQQLATWAFSKMTAALLATTTVDPGGWFDAPWRAMLAVAATLALPIVLIGTATEALAGRPGMAVRRGLLLPLAIAPALLAARALLGLALTLVDSACALVVQVGIGGPSGFGQALTHMGGLLGVPTAAAGQPVGVGAGAGDILVLLFTAFLSFVIWVELAVRAALVYLLAAFVPLALAGLFWSATSRWTRRLLEVLAAVLLSQLVITVLMVLAAAALGAHPDGLARGVDTLAVGLALLFLGSLGLPMTLRLLPHVVEASVAAGAGAAVASRVRQHSSQLLAAAPHPAARLAGGALAGRVPPARSGTPSMPVAVSTSSAGSPSAPPSPRPATPQPAPPASSAGGARPARAGGRAT